MSHFLTYVFTIPNGANIEELLAKYDENLEYPKYLSKTKAQVIEESKKSLNQWLESKYYKDFIENPQKLKTESPSQAEFLESIPNILESNEKIYKFGIEDIPEDCIDSQGNVYSTYNPYSKWDWYKQGGRWRDNPYEGKTVKELLKEKEIITPFAFVTPSGEWHEKGEMGFWACVTNPKKPQDWENEFLETLKKLDGTTICNVVDCHI